MGKSRRKFVKKEKAKVKLKESKTQLPKGQNLTDTNFKIKKIVIKDQVKVYNKDELLTTRKLNVQDLLSRLGHHNVNIKKEAIEGFSELISSHTTKIIQSYLSILLQNCAKLILDVIGSIRKDAIKLIANIFSCVECNNLEPFFPSLSSYLVCGLTHIDCGIKEDSLHYLDVLLKFVPKLCAKSASKILPVLLDLVSYSDSQNRTLSLNLDTSSTSIKWRISVLTRIQLLLSALSDLNNKGSGIEMCLENNDGPMYNKTRTFSDFLKMNESTLSKLELNCLNRGTVMSEEFSLKSFSDATIPLLLDMFVEIVPQKEDIIGSSPDVCTIVRENDAVILKNILDILKLLWDIISRENNSTIKLNSLSKEHGKAIVTKLVKGKFPYALRTNAKRKRGGNMENGVMDTSCRIQNLTLCKIVLQFGNITDWNYVIPYLKNCFRNTNLLSNNECNLFTSCILTICTESNTEESKYFLNQVSKTVNNSNCSLANYFFLFLTDIALDRKFKYFYSEVSFTSWLYSLPKKLTKSKISATILDKICQICVRNYRPFIESLDSHIESILDNIPKIQVEHMDEQKAHLKIASLLYYVQEWDNELVQGINEAINKKYWGTTVTEYIQNILNLKLQALEISKNENLITNMKV